MSRNLHIGGTVRMPGWEVLNALPGDHVDHLGDARDLSQFPAETFDLIYGSHVLEHFDHVRDAVEVLKEWKRVLTENGRLLVSVPDLEVLCRLFIDKTSTTLTRIQIMRMIFGGHVDEYDYHMVGFSEGILSEYLRAAGFAGCHRVASHGIFQDTSEMVFQGTKISLNMVAYKSWIQPHQDGPVDEDSI